MVKKKHKDGVWHHRVPDFQLVYCGPQSNVPPNTTKLGTKEKIVNFSLSTEKSDLLSNSKEQKKR